MKLKFILSAALLGLADSLRGHRVATNAEPPAVTAVSVGLPDGLDPQKVLARKVALIKAGTEPLIAEKFAIDAEQQQAARDRHKKIVVETKEVPAKEKVAKVTTKPDGSGEEKGDGLDELTIADLTELAEKKKFDLGGATKKADILAAIRAAKVLIIALFLTLFLGASGTASAATPVASIAAQVSSQVIDLPTLAIVDQSLPDLAVTIGAADLIVWRNPLSIALLAMAALVAVCGAVQRSSRLGFLASLWLRRIGDALRGQRLAFNAVMTPTETLDGVANLHGTAAIATKNYVVVRGADDRHFKIPSAVTDVPLGILRNDEIATAEVDVETKGIALFGVFKGTLTGVAEAAIAVDALLTPGVGTPGRVKTLPVTTAGTYWVIGRNRFTVANAGDPVSIEHCLPYQVTVGQKAEIVTAANIITADESGKTFFLDLAGGFTSTLPAAQLGLKFTFQVKTAPTTAYIILAAAADTIIGYPVASTGGDESANGNAAGDQINFVANTALPGDRVVLESDGTSWFVTPTCKATGAITITG